MSQAPLSMADLLVLNEDELNELNSLQRLPNGPESVDGFCMFAHPDDIENMRRSATVFREMADRTPRDKDGADALLAEIQGWANFIDGLADRAEAELAARRLP